MTENVAGGYCTSDKFSEARGHAPDTFVYSYDEDGSFWTGPQFGCVHHKPRE